MLFLLNTSHSLPVYSDIKIKLGISGLDFSFDVQAITSSGSAIVGHGTKNVKTAKSFYKAVKHYTLLLSQTLVASLHPKPNVPMQQRRNGVMELESHVISLNHLV